MKTILELGKILTTLNFKGSIVLCDCSICLVLFCSSASSRLGNGTHPKSKFVVS